MVSFAIVARLDPAQSSLQVAVISWNSADLFSFWKQFNEFYEITATCSLLCALQDLNVLQLQNRPFLQTLNFSDSVKEKNQDANSTTCHFFLDWKIGYYIRMKYLVADFGGTL